MFVKVFEEFLNLVLPSSCVLCAQRGSPVCNRCQNEFACSGYSVRRSNFNGVTINGFAISQYDKNAATLVHELKENSQTYLASVLAKQMAEALRTRVSADVRISLVPMPSKKMSFQKRGFNPAHLLAKKVAANLSIHGGLRIGVENCLSLNRQVLDQASLVGLERRENLREAMSLIKKPIAQEIWLVDDVVTTGSTLLEATRCLGESGANVSGFAVFAETLPKNQQKASDI